MIHRPLTCAIVLAGQAATAQPTWDWQLTAPFDLSRDVQFLGLDPDNHSTDDIAGLRAAGVAPLCYVSVGTLEDWRGDVAAFPPEVVGGVYGDWPDERFLDIRQLDVLLPLMAARFEVCRAMGFLGVEPDNQDIYTNDSGFDLKREDTLRYLNALADLAHGMGLWVAQKNVPELTPGLYRRFDLAMTEGCHAEGWCDQMLPYVGADKPVLAAEYTDTDVDFAAACLWGAEAGVSFILNDRDLDQWRGACP